MLPDQPHCDHIQLCKTNSRRIAFLGPIELILLIHCSSEDILENMENIDLHALKWATLSFPPSPPETKIVLAEWFAPK